MGQSLKNIVDQYLQEKNRSLSWLAAEMGKTFDGLKLSLVKGSLKYNDIITLLKLLDIKPGVLFGLPDPPAKVKTETPEDKNCKEMVAALKSQLKDKDQIIALLMNRKTTIDDETEKP